MLIALRYHIWAKPYWMDISILPWVYLLSQCQAIPSTRYFLDTPLIIGTNILNHLKSIGYKGGFEFQNSVASLPGSLSVPVTVFHEKVVTINPFETRIEEQLLEI